MRSWESCSRIHGSVHVHRRNAIELGSSYLVEDFLPALPEEKWKRGALRECFASRHGLPGNRGGACGVTAWLVSAGWKIVLELGAGTGGVYLPPLVLVAVNAWSEISAMMAALVTTLALHSTALWMAIAAGRNPSAVRTPSFFAKTTLCTTGSPRLCG